MRNCVATPKNPATNTVYFINPATNKKVKFVATKDKKQLPFSNNFKQLYVLNYEQDTTGDVVLVVLCTRNSFEPGRKYFISYNMLTQECTGYATAN